MQSIVSPASKAMPIHADEDRVFYLLEAIPYYEDLFVGGPLQKISLLLLPVREEMMDPG